MEQVSINTTSTALWLQTIQESSDILLDSLHLRYLMSLLGTDL
jgi:hypothetical protein